MFSWQQLAGRRPFTRQLDDWTALLISCAAGLYILRCLPPVLGPHGALGALLLVVAGLVMGLLLAGAAVVVAFLLATHQADGPAASAASVHEPTLSSSSAPKNAAAGGQQAAAAGGQPAGRRLEEELLQEMHEALQAYGPPQPLAHQGEYGGWVWTASSADWPRQQVIPNWPPATTGPCAVKKWYASLRSGTLYLLEAPCDQQPQADKLKGKDGSQHSQVGDASHSGRGAGSGLTPPAAGGPSGPALIEIPLAGCSVTVVAEGLLGKTRWWKKAPIEVCHPERLLLGNQRGFMLWTVSAACKEQWTTALLWAAEHGGAPCEVDRLYAAFCIALRSAAHVAYPQMSEQHDDGGETDLEGGRPGGGKSKARWGWKGNWALRRSPAKSKSHTPRSQAKKEAAVISPETVEKLWMEHKVGDTAHKAAQASNSASVADPVEGDVVVGGSPRSGTALVEARAPSDRGTPTAKGRSTLQPEPSAGSDTSMAAGTPFADRQSRATFDLDAYGGRRGTGDGQGGEAASHSGLYAGIAVEHAINMLLARVSFDLMRSPDFNTRVTALVQRKLNELKLPEYMHTLRVVEVDCGSAAPSVANLRALPSPGAAIWPQALFELAYEGDLAITLETKVDLRDGAMWNTFDQAMTRWEGTAATAAAAVAAVGSGLATEVTSPTAGSDSEDEATADASSAAGQPQGSSKAGAGEGKARRRLMDMPWLRKAAAKKLRHLAEVTADSISRIPLQLTLRVKALRGTMCVWLPPPPGDRLWYCFLQPPQLELAAKPLVGGRFLKYSAAAMRVSAWIESKMQRSVNKNMVYPACNDLLLPMLLGLDHPAAAATSPALAALLAAARPAPDTPAAPLEAAPAPGMPKSNSMPAAPEAAPAGTKRSPRPSASFSSFASPPAAPPAVAPASGSFTAGSAPHAASPLGPSRSHRPSSEAGSGSAAGAAGAPAGRSAPVSPAGPAAAGLSQADVAGHARGSAVQPAMPDAAPAATASLHSRQTAAAQLPSAGVEPAAHGETSATHAAARLQQLPAASLLPLQPTDPTPASGTHADVPGMALSSQAAGASEQSAVPDLGTALGRASRPPSSTEEAAAAAVAAVPAPELPVTSSAALSHPLAATSSGSSQRAAPLAQSSSDLLGLVDEGPLPPQPAPSAPADPFQNMPPITAQTCQPISPSAGVPVALQDPLLASPPSAPPAPLSQLDPADQRERRRSADHERSTGEAGQPSSLRHAQSGGSSHAERHLQAADASRSPSAGTALPSSPAHSDAQYPEGASEGDELRSSEDGDAGSVPGSSPPERGGARKQWLQGRLGQLGSSSMAKNWEAFKAGGSAKAGAAPAAQGRHKLAANLASLRGQAQERMRKVLHHSASAGGAASGGGGTTPQE